MEFGDNVFQQWIDKLPRSNTRLCAQIKGPTISESTFNELAVGYLLIKELGYKAEYEKEVEGLTPDWYVHSTGTIRSFCVEILTRENRPENKLGIGKSFRGGPLFPWWVTLLDDPIKKKMRKYTRIPESGIPFVVGVAANFFHGANKQDLIETCRGASGLFMKRPGLSGVIWIEKIERNRCWKLSPLYNPHARNPLPNNAIG